jgi:hypothetical protein
MTSTWWRYTPPRPEEAAVARLVFLIMLDVLLALYVTLAFYYYVRWDQARDAYKADTSCASRSVVVDGSRSLLLPMSGCVETGGTIVGMGMVTHRRNRTDYYLTVRLSDGEVREERIAHADDRGWRAVRRGDGVMAQLYRGTVTAIYTETTTMRTANNPITETSEWGQQIAISSIIVVLTGWLTVTNFRMIRRASA